MGETQGAVGKRKSGYNKGVDTIIEVRSEDADLAYQTVEKALEIVSGDAADDGKSSGTLTLVSATSLVNATGTVTCASVLAGDTVTINGNVYTAVAGAKADNTEFSIDTSDDACAADLADSINNDVRVGTLGDVSASATTNVVTCTQSVTAGAAGNATTLVSSNGTRLAVSGAGTFTGGTDADVATVNGLTYTGVAGVKANNTQFSVDTSDTAAAADLADSINNDTRTPITVPTVTVTATPAAGVVTIDSDVGGTAGDLVDISGTANITASGATLTDVGTGARSVVVEGLDGSYNEISETVYLNGVTPVALVNSYLRVNDAYVDEVGSGGVNAGLITIRLASAGAVQITIPLGLGQAQVTNYTVGLGKEISIKDLDITVSQVAANAVSVAVNLWKRLFGDSWRVIDTYTLGNGSKHIDFENDELELPAKTDIKITATKIVGTGDATVESSYSFREYNK